MWQSLSRQILFVFCLFVVALAPFVSSAVEESSVAVPFLPETLDEQTVYVTPHIDLTPTNSWEAVRVPFVDIDTALMPNSVHGYNYEIWDQNNRPIAPHVSRSLDRWRWEASSDVFFRLDESTLRVDLTAIDPTQHSRVRVVVFPTRAVFLNELIVPLAEQETMQQRAEQAGYPLATFSVERSFHRVKLLVVVLSVVVALAAVLALAFFLRSPVVSWKVVWRVVRHPAAIVQLSSKERSQYLAGIVVQIVFATAVYGALLGTFWGGVQVWYVLVKLPVLFLAGLLVSFFSSWFLTRIMGSEQTPKQALFVALLALAGFAWVLAVFVPVLSIFLLVQPIDHAATLLLHVGVFGLAGLVAAFLFWRAQRAISGKRLLFFRSVLWFVLYGLVTTQIGWMLRPWVGLVLPGQEIPFLRLAQGNVLEALVQTFFRL